MNRSSLRLALAPLLVLALAPGTLFGQAQRARLFHSDSIDVTEPALSPDGKWLVYSRTEALNRASLWIQPAAGGDARRLTSTGHFDIRPRWATGDRLFFVSTRPARSGDANSYVMLLPMNGATGEAAGPPRQVTADAAGGAMRPSPDGELVAYQYALNGTKLRVVPATGGAAREVATFPGRVNSIGWSADGKSLFVGSQFPGRKGVAYQVPLAGGEPRQLPVQGSGFIFANDGRLAATLRDGPGARERVIQIVSLEDGKVLQELPANVNIRPSAFSADSRSLLAFESNIVAPTRLLSINGGQPRDLTPGNAYDWVLGFNHDGTAVYTWTENREGNVLALVPLGKGQRKEWPQVRGSTWEAANREWLLRQVQRGNDRGDSLIAVSLKDGSRHVVAGDLRPDAGFASGPGGEYASLDEVYPIRINADRHEVHGWTAPGRSRLVRSFAERPADVAVHGSRVAWVENRGDSAFVFIADGPDGQPRRLHAQVRPTTGAELAFSHDGRLLALHETDAQRRDLLLILDASGKTAARVLDTGMAYWYWPRWLPDDSGIVVLAGTVGSDSHVVLLPLAAGAKPVNLTRNDPAPKWGFELSRDGKWLAYPAEVWKGSSIWRYALK